MKTKQLANVLIKILGLSVCVHAVPSLIDVLLHFIRARVGSSPGEFWFPVSSVVWAALGLYLIVKSRDVAEFLFKSENE